MSFFRKLFLFCLFVLFSNGCTFLPLRKDDFFTVEKIMIDPGHGGTDPGGVGTELKEKDIVLDLGLKLAHLLKKKFKVYLTRQKDIFIPLPERSQLANQKKVDLFISLHINAAPYKRDRRGIETYIFNLEGTDEEAVKLAKRENRSESEVLDFILKDLRKNSDNPYSLRLAHCLQSRLVKELGWPDRGVKTAPFFVLSQTEMPAVLLEIGFITHPEEQSLLKKDEVRQKAARAIYKGILDYLEEIKKMKRQYAMRK
jgi:N-acetylmuramoyl-L-alanine amidase